MTSSQNFEAENDLPSASVAPAVHASSRQRHRQRVVVIERQAAVQRVVAVQPQAEPTEAGQRAQPPVVRHHAGLGHARGARGEDVERLVLGQHRRRRRPGCRWVPWRQAARAPRRSSSPLVSAPLSVIGSIRVGFGDDRLGVEQSDAVGEDVAALVVVEHSCDRAALDHGEHQQHRVRASCAA